MKSYFVLLGIFVIVALVYCAIRIRSRGAANTGKADVDSQTKRDVAALTRPLNRPTILLRTTEAETNSYFGGAPPAHQGFEWPRKGGRPLGFLACVDLGSLPTDTGIDWLPTAGRLLFFYDMEEQPWGFDPKDRGGWKVIYVPESNPISGDAPLPADLKSDWQIRKRGIEFDLADLPPCWERDEVAALNMSDAEIDEFIDYRSELYGSTPHHQIGGYPDPVQGPDMDIECQFVSHGLYCGDASGFNDPRAEELKKGAGEWRLLLQMDTDDDLDVMWGDVGMLYFWVRREDAQQKRFEDVWLVMQCS